VAKQEGSWVDPQRLKVEFEDWTEHFMATGLWKAKTRADYEGLLRVLILPTFGAMALGRIDQVAVKEWVAALHKRGLSPYRIRNAYRLLSKILKTAVQAGYLPRNVAEGSPCPGSSRATGPSSRPPKSPGSFERCQQSAAMTSWSNCSPTAGSAGGRSVLCGGAGASSSGRGCSSPSRWPR
jgi:hypothetical protein